MTHEQNFRTSFISQFTIYTGFQNILSEEIKKLPQSSFPVFSLDLGKTKYTQFDLAGKAIQGEQEFIVTAYYSLPLRSTDDAFHDHSDVQNLFEQFMNNPIYSPPAVIFGDTYRIERTKLIEMKAPAIAFGDTRFLASASGKYVFTLF